jgi:rhomboid protease GluP
MQAPPEERPAPAGKRPWITWTIAALCVAVFVAVSLGRRTSGEEIERWLAPRGQAIWRCAYGGLVTSAFVHLELWHLAFNLYWLWVFGRVLEGTLGPLRWLAFFLAAAFVSSGAELAATADTGIGLSGAVYAVFGFMWVSRRAYPAFAAVVTRQTVPLFLGWLVFCVFATRLGFLRVANVAHTAGLAFGLAVAWAFVLRPRAILPKAALAALCAGSLVGLFWCPWQFQWVATKAYDAQMRGEYGAAVDWYLKAERFHEEPAWVLRNLALAYMRLSDADRFMATMERLRKVDPAAARELGGPGPALSSTPASAD